MDIVRISPAAPEFAAPPAEPMTLVRAWFANASANNVDEPGAMALATADAVGRASNRIVKLLELRDDGVTFTSHSGSVKGRQLAQTGFASGVIYWRETCRQLILSGPTRPLPEEESDAIWAARPSGTHPISVLSEQSRLLLDEAALRQRAAGLARSGKPLKRPDTWIGYILEPTSIEFWQADPERLHQRLLYERKMVGWKTSRLQP